MAGSAGPRAQIRLGHDGRERNEQHPEHLAVLAPIVQRALVAGQKARGEEHHRDLRELAGLHLHADLDPGLRPHARVGAEARNVGQKDEHHVDDEQRRGEVRKAPVVEGPQGHHGHEPHRHALQLAGEVVVGIPLDCRPADHQAVGDEHRDDGKEAPGHPREQRGCGRARRAVGRSALAGMNRVDLGKLLGHASPHGRRNRWRWRPTRRASRRCAPASPGTCRRRNP